MKKQSVFAYLCLLFCWSCWSATPEQAQVAVASNFAAPIQELAKQFENQSGHKLLLVIGSTGKFFAQIKQGAPYDILIAADQATPAKLGAESVPGTQFTYAVGTLVLWSQRTDLVDSQGAVLKSGKFNHLAIASPEQAPYGKAAIQTLRALGLADILAQKLVQGESISQAYRFVETGNADCGFVALSQVWVNGKVKSGSIWLVPRNLYEPLRQDAVLLNRGKANLAAIAFIAFLKSNAARDIMQRYGYQF